MLLLSTVAFSTKAQTITELASKTDDLSTLVTALKAAGLAETLAGEGPFTVFAPTNAAFEALPDGVLEMLLKPENKDKLKAVLTYHVIGGKVMSSDLTNGSMTATVEGSDVKFTVGPKVKVNDANVVKADISASNGVVHIIDNVILPPSMQ
jgi:uncharacterized surface protein with fasciclin (FAS1) repeats